MRPDQMPTAANLYEMERINKALHLRNIAETFLKENFDFYCEETIINLMNLMETNNCDL